MFTTHPLLQHTAQSGLSEIKAQSTKENVNRMTTPHPKNQFQYRQPDNTANLARSVKFSQRLCCTFKYIMVSIPLRAVFPSAVNKKGRCIGYPHTASFPPFKKHLPQQLYSRLRVLSRSTTCTGNTLLPTMVAPSSSFNRISTAAFPISRYG